MGTFGKRPMKPYLTVPFSMQLTGTKLDRKFAAHPFVPEDMVERNRRCEDILSIQAFGLKKRYEHIGCKTAVLGISGGLDSTLALLVTVRTFDLLGLPRSGIIAVTMPCFGTTDRTYENACLLAKTLGTTLREVDQRIEISPRTPEAQKRMFYTGLYHTMIMPVDRSGENPLWADDEPYYDDFYAIWDTYRTSTPLITLIDPKRETDIVRSLINIYKRDGYMPDARSGNSNGRTQGGSNAEIVIADAFVKGLEGIDYELGLQAMLKDATVCPGDRHEAEGRGGLIPYLELGYIPYGIPRAGNRTVEYSYCDYAIALVAKGLGKEDLYQHYLKQSGNWKNLWRDDYEQCNACDFAVVPPAASYTLAKFSGIAGYQTISAEQPHAAACANPMAISGGR